MSLSIVEKKPDYSVEPITKTVTPIVTGASLIGIFYKGGVMVASDTLYCYGGLAKFFDQQRIEKINQNVLISSSGELSDFQEIIRQLNEMELKTQLYDDGNSFTPKDYSNYLSHKQYAMRNKFNPYFLQNVVAGYSNGERYLASVDQFGCKIENSFVLTGFANYMCKPILANYWNPECDEATARQIMIECFKILFYRHCRTTDKIQIGIIDANGARVEAPFVLETKWDHEQFRSRASEKLYA